MFLDFLYEIPPVTRVLGFISISNLFLIQITFIDRHLLYFNATKISEGQIWRIISSLLPINFDIWTIYLVMLFILISSSLERLCGKRGSIDYLYFNFICLVIVNIVGFVFHIGSLSWIYFIAMFYNFCLINENGQVLINFILVKKKYIVWYILTLMFITGDSYLIHLIGIVVGHLLNFMFNIYPRLGMCRNKDKNLFDTPQFFVKLVTPLFNRQNTVQQNPQLNQFAHI